MSSKTNKNKLVRENKLVRGNKSGKERENKLNTGQRKNIDKKLITKQRKTNDTKPHTEQRKTNNTKDNTGQRKIKDKKLDTEKRTKIDKKLKAEQLKNIDTKPSNISTHKSIKKNPKQAKKYTQRKSAEINDFKAIYNKKRSSSAKQYSKESMNKKANTNTIKTNALKNRRSKSVNRNYIESNSELHIKIIDPMDTHTTPNLFPITRTSKNDHYDPDRLRRLTQAKHRSNSDPLKPKNIPVLRTKNLLPDIKTQEGRKKIARETMKIIYGKDAGKYIVYEHGVPKKVDISEKISNCVKNTETIIKVQYDTWNAPSVTEPNCLIEVRPESSFGAASRLTSLYKTCVLNFASATKPGGGFINGKAAQEESLSRQSALFKSLQKEKFMYMHHKVNKSDFKYTDYMIYSPSVPVFRDDKTEKLLSENNIFCTDVITSAAPNKAEMVKHGQDTKCLHNILYTRCEKILRCAIDHGAKALVLGAFGCGVFGNDPKIVSQIFKDLLVQKGYKKYFKTVVFAILDSNSKNFQEFKKTFRGV